MILSLLIAILPGQLSDDPTDFTSHSLENKIVIHAESVRSAAPSQKSHHRGKTDQTQTFVSYGCGGHGTTQTNCDGLITSAIAVCTGTFSARPRMVYVYDENGVLLSSSFVAGNCSTSPVPNNPEPVTVSAEDFKQLPLKGSGITIAPDLDSYFINLPILATTSSEPQMLATTILGTPVRIKATPTQYSWNFADPESNQTVAGQNSSHTYSIPGHYTVTLTTEWTGQFTTNNGATWQPINGTATTTNTSEPLALNESAPRLTAGDKP